MPSPLTRKVGPLPAWGWAVAIVGGVLVVLWLRGRRSSSSTSAQGGGTLSPYDYSLMANPNATGTGGNPTIVETLPPDLLSALGGVIVGQAQTLEGVAVNAQSALAQISSYGLTSAFGFAESISGQSFALAGQALALEQVQPQIVSYSSGGGGGGGGGSSSAGAAPTPAPSSQSLTPAQQVSHSEFQARQASYAATGQWTAGL